MLAPLTLPDGKELLQLCRSGRLYAIEEWIQGGRSLQVPPECRHTPLQVAVDTGFHSLIELLVRNEPSQTEKNRALDKAVALRRKDFVELLIAHGAEATSVPFSSVLMTWDPAMFNLFLEHGADPLGDLPFTCAFEARIKTALRALIDLKKARPDIAFQLQAQADRALRHYCREGDLKWVSLLIWAGANPRTRGPVLYDDDDVENYVTGLQEACYAGHVEILKKLKPSPATDDMADLFRCTAFLVRIDAMRYLLSLGAVVNDRPNGGSAALDSCLGHLWLDAYSSRIEKKSKYQVSKTFDAVKLLLEHGALWRPEGGCRFDSLRHGLLSCEPNVALELLNLLRRHNATQKEDIEELLKNKKMEQHLASEVRTFERWGLQLGPKKKLKKGEPETVWVTDYVQAKYDRNELYEKLWAAPTRTVAQEYGISDVALAKVCRKMRVPMPGRGYWAKKTAGKPVKSRPPLPQIVLK